MPKRKLAIGMSVGEGVGRGHSAQDYLSPYSLIGSLNEWYSQAAYAAGRDRQWPAMTAIWNFLDRSPLLPAPLGSQFPEEGLMIALHSRLILPVIFMHTTSFGQPETRLQNWVRGDFDTKMKEWGRQASLVGLPFVLRLNQEPNGDWAPWSTSFYNQTAQDYVLAWHRCIDMIRIGMGSQAHLMKTWYTPMGSPPKALALQDLAGNGVADYYPGRDYVDWLGFDKYSVFGDNDPPIITAYKSIFDKVKVLGPQPIYVGETGIKQLEDNDVYRGRLWEQGLSDLKSTPGWSRFKGLMYFNIDMTLSEKRSWVITGTQPDGLLTVWGRTVAQPRYQGKLV